MKYSHLLSSILLSLVISTNLIFSQSIIQDGPVSGKWSLIKSPYLIKRNIEIPDDYTLIFDAGILIEF